MAIPRRNRPMLRILLPVLLAGIALGVAWLRAESRPAGPGSPPARRVAAVASSWRALRLLWRTPVSLSDSMDSRVRDMHWAESQLYYVGDGEVGCVSAATGKLQWKQSLVLPGVLDTSWMTGRERRLAIADGKVFLSEAHVYSPPPPPPYLVLALDAATGAPLWRSEQSKRLSGRPVPVKDTLLVATEDGMVLALRLSDGRLRWQKRWMPASDSHGTAPILHVRGEGSVGVAQLGTGELVGFRAGDGKELWRVGSKQPDGGATGSEGFIVHAGVAYASLVGTGVLAVELATGKRRWTRNSEYALLFAPQLLGQRLLGSVDKTLVGLNTRTGVTEWFQPRNDLSELMPPAGSASVSEPLLKIRSLPRIAGRSVETLTVPELETLAALDPVTGREAWRWQPSEGTQLRQVVQNGDQLFATDGSELFCYGPGEEPGLPSEAGARRRLAQETVDFLFLQQTPHHAPDGRTSYPPSDSEQLQGRLRLLRLGKEAVPVLLAQARADLEREEVTLPSPEEVKNSRMPSGGRNRGSVLDLLADLGEPDSVVELIRLAERLKNPLSQDQVVEALVHFGDRRAAPFLFRYACDEAAHPLLRRAALHFACRAGAANGLRQQEVTGYLRDQLGRPQAPLWLRQYARFELLNDRGEQAQTAALAAFRQERTAKLLPDPADNVGRRPDAWGPFGFSREGAVRDERGVWWSTCTSSYLGGEGQHFWIAQSRDGEKWVRPAFARTLGSDIGWNWQIKQRYRAGSLVLDLSGESRQGQKSVPVHRQLVVSLADIYLDTDRDGLPDRLERLIGTDPQRSDTNGNGLPDATDKNPTYRPHALTDEEAIYQAALEGLCQLGRTAPAEPYATEMLSSTPSTLGRSGEPLLLPLSPGSRGIEILGYPGTVLFDRKLAQWGSLTLGALLDRNRFVSPQVGLDGTPKRQTYRRPSWQGPPHDPLQDPVPLLKLPDLSFREYFPYELSADRTRARVGWSESYQGIRSYLELFDVEVRKIQGRWHPVECRQVYASFGMNGQVLPVPVRPLR